MLRLGLVFQSLCIIECEGHTRQTESAEKTHKLMHTDYYCDMQKKLRCSQMRRRKWKAVEFREENIWCFM